MPDTKTDSAGSDITPMAAPGKKSHFKRFWWVYLLVFLIIATVIVVPSVLLVAVPKIAQQKLDGAKLTIDGITVTNTQTDSLIMAINSTIEADDSVHATVDAFQGTMYLADVDPPLAFAHIDFPQTTSSSMQAVNVSQEIRISNQDAFTTFNKALLSSVSVNVQVKGDTHIHVRGVSRAYPATFDKTVALAGLNNFDGLSISDPSISIRVKGNFNATVHIPNPSVLTLEIGNTTFTSFLNNEDVGQTYINNLILRPGNNTFVTTADIQQLPILKALTQKPLCELDGKLPFQLKGKDVVNKGQVLPYFRDALAASSQNVTIDLSEAAKKIGITAKCIGL
ncbi:hypothetical protein F5B22DRAFT_625287 [Xylaria bambusicola]|uniref:uncharacterized protein n=1 Tax=Xylaria bambusicola TaxID=326684 RepID=UPI002007B331|nr:uncharacterized protein F5B22DRAFT_625287 [Xylaria bambusicola]KAI0506117.1 hypothetical protein F5B22DRAFT_625287 [Xylaria bambusicola]